MNWFAVVRAAWYTHARTVPTSRHTCASRIPLAWHQARKQEKEEELAHYSGDNNNPGDLPPGAASSKQQGGLLARKSKARLHTTHHLLIRLI